MGVLFLFHLLWDWVVFIVSLCCFAHVIVGKLLLLIWKEIRQLCCFFLFCPKNACWESSARESYETVRLWKTVCKPGPKWIFVEFLGLDFFLGLICRGQCSLNEALLENIIVYWIGFYGIQILYHINDCLSVFVYIHIIPCSKIMFD